MELEKRIENIKNYFVEMKVIIMKDDDGKNTHVIYVTVNLPEKWIIDEGTEEKYGVSYISVGNSWENQFSFFAELSTGINAVFDAIEYNIQSNIVAEKKVSILHDKMEELKKMFQNEKYNVEDLEKLNFNFSNRTVSQTSFGTKIAEKTEDKSTSAGAVFEPEESNKKEKEDKKEAKKK